MDWLHFLSKVNDVLTAGVGATTLALALYLWFYNRKSPVARAFIGLLGCVLVVYLADLLLTNITDLTRASLLLRFQWLGIAFTPSFYLAFIRAIRSSVQEKIGPRWQRAVSFLVSGGLALLAMYSDLVVYDGTASAGVFHLRPGPLFYPFAGFFIAVTLWGMRESLLARHRCYTQTARRRMGYLLVGFVAPAVGVFPYLLLSGWPHSLPNVVLWVLLIVSNVAVAAMLAMIAYSVAFIGTFTPDRVIKHRLVRFLLRGPLAAILALSLFGLGLTLEPTLRLGRFSLSLISMAVAIILTQLGVELAKPVIDLLLYREARAEVAQVQELSQRLLTTADLRQFTENVRAAMCELLHSPGGFQAIYEEESAQWEIWWDAAIAPEERDQLPLPEVVEAHDQTGFIFWDGYWVLPIHDKGGQTLLGLMGLRSPEVTLPLTPEQSATLAQLSLQTTAALEDRRLQKLVFSTLSPLLPELQDIQRRGGMLRYDREDVGGFTLAESQELPRWVHDALSHYWGGPRLTENPLLGLEIVKQAALAHDGNVVKGLRAVLAEAIERLRPDGERKLTAPEWLLYNILEMKFLRGQKVREVAVRLAVSESDLYRKQRIAIENLAIIIVEMEEEVRQVPASMPKPTG
ncbi:MAG: hypothetical protein JXA21_23745 [Anaerolineae bacterium]|nr:hypothetical protein [Anaerolineae bacterium]